jgi:hypothetical protein
LLFGPLRNEGQKFQLLLRLQVHLGSEEIEGSSVALGNSHERILVISKNFGILSVLSEMAVLGEFARDGKAEADVLVSALFELLLHISDLLLKHVF